MRSLPRCLLSPRMALQLAAALSLGACDGLVLDVRGADPIGSRDWVEPGPTDPGRVTMRRLNRTELENTVHDLLGIDGPISQDFPADDRGYGYDVIGDVLSTSALHVELLSQQAEAWVDRSLGTEAEPGPGRERILTCDADAEGESCARTILRAFARRAWRRPASETELDRLVALIDLARTHGDPASTGVRLGLVSILVSPHFFYRVEIDDVATPHPVTDYELASRLAYFLWASTPDDMLLDLAEAGVLSDDAILASQVERMLDDERASSLVADFAGQWLFTRLVEDHVVDGEVYPEWTPDLARSAEGEMDRFFESFLTDDLPISDLLTSDAGYVDDRLAAHYGIEIPADATRDDQGFARVELPADRRAGLLSKAGLLAVTSQPNRTSPVKRGVWVLEQLLCFAPPPPPPEVEGLDGVEPIPGETLRQRFERHRSDPVCAACHMVMDPIGFGLEGFDGIGRIRTMDGGGMVDDSGELPTGETFEGAAELGAILSEDPRFAQCVTRQMMTYALGRGVEHREDDAWVEVLTERAALRGGTLRDLIVEVVTSSPFRMRTPEVTP